MNSSNLKNKLNQGKLTVGSWITIGDAAIAEIFSNAGFDWLVIDLEHSSISIDQAGDLIRTIDLSGVAPLVRLTSNDPNQIKRVMDCGAHGIVVPSINSAYEASLAVASTRYAPDGLRGVGLARAQDYGSNFTGYLEWQKTSPVVIVQIEHINALDNLEAIFTTKGVDGFIIGPYDLSCSMGMPGDFHHPEFKEVVQKILRAGKESGCPSGIHLVEPDAELLNNTIEEGYKFIAYSVDIRMLDVSARHGTKIIKKDL